ncbi:MAG: helix-turn-helix domain-containing protein, partial [Candidatus Aenigmarchaeota archaeon]|nr:helix-turn-helix domain-containing protein [Candidatus Aenigmarchaeota archaeon]
ILNGGLLSDASIREKDGKYYYFQWTAKTKKFLEWIKNLLEEKGVKNAYISISNYTTKTFMLGFYLNKYADLVHLRQKWYKQINGKTIKVVPKDLVLTPTTLLFWYLGDGSLVKRRNDDVRIPAVVLATNNFLKDDVDLLIKKLRELNLSFYPVKYKSGFTGKDCGYALWSKTSDGTPFRFFQLIGFEPPKNIARLVTGRKGRYSRPHFFLDKWPSEKELLRMLSNVKQFGRIFKMRRKKLGLTQREVANLVGVSREHVRNIENCKRCGSFKVFMKMLNILFNSYYQNVFSYEFSGY